MITKKEKIKLKYFKEKDKNKAKKGEMAERSKARVC